MEKWLPPIIYELHQKIAEMCLFGENCVWSYIKDLIIVRCQCASTAI